MKKSILSKVIACSIVSFLMFSCATNSKKALADALSQENNTKQLQSTDTNVQTDVFSEITDNTKVDAYEKISEEDLFLNEESDVTPLTEPDSIIDDSNLQKEEAKTEAEPTDDIARTQAPDYTVNDDSDSFLVPKELIDTTPLPEQSYGSSSGTQPYKALTVINDENNDSPNNAAEDNAQLTIVDYSQDLQSKEETEKNNKNEEQLQKLPDELENIEKAETELQSQNDSVLPEIKDISQKDNEAQITEDTPSKIISDNHSNDSDNNKRQQEPDIIIPSRAVTIKNNQYLDIIYPGSGWIYLGEYDSSKHLSYFGRKLGTKDTSFTLRSRLPGMTFVHFYKVDALTGNYIDDYLQITITEESANSGERQTAPAYAQIVPQKPERRVVNEVLKTKTVTPLQETDKEKAMEVSSASVQNQNELTQKKQDANEAETKKTESTAETYDDLSKLDLAKQAYENKEYEKALELVRDYIDRSTSLFDQAYYLQGQILEADSPVRNIRSAIDSYNYVLKNFPSSKLWKSANDRTTYLKRFYIDIR